MDDPAAASVSHVVRAIWRQAKPARPVEAQVRSADDHSAPGWLKAHDLAERRVEGPDPPVWSDLKVAGRGDRRAVDRDRIAAMRVNAPKLPTPASGDVDRAICSSGHCAGLGVDVDEPANASLAQRWERPGTLVGGRRKGRATAAWRRQPFGRDRLEGVAGRRPE